MISKIKKKAKEILLWSQKYTKTDMVYLARGGFWLTLGQGISSISSFLLAIAFANLLPKETYGTYKYILSIASILAIPTLSGMGTAVTQAVARGYEGSLIPALKTKIRWGLLGGLASLILAGYYFYQGNTTLTISFLISAVFLPFMDSFGIYDDFLQGKKLFDFSSKYLIISQIIAISSLIVVLWSTKNLFFILLAYFTSWTLLRFTFFKLTLKKFSPNQSEDVKTISYGKHLSLVDILNLIAGQLDKIILFHFLGPISLAIYSFAVAPIAQIRSFLKPIVPLSLPKLASGESERIKKTLLPKLLKFFLILLIIVIAYIISAPFFYKIFFPKYLDSIKYSQYLALVLLFFPKKLLTVTLLAQAKIREIYISIAGSLFYIVLLFVLTPFYGIFGVITAEIISHILNTLLLLYLFRRA
jgi:O-antigen/teichoic acid export membrane protein